jgi:acyl-CoA synthetase (AMP-forming)/AMP-acid ligase II
MRLRSLSLEDIIRRNAQLFPRATALVFGDERITHGDYLRRVERLAAGLAASGVVPGDRVAVLARNCPEYADLVGAVAFLGGNLVPVNWRLNAEEVAYVLADGDPKVVVAGPEDQAAVAAMRGSLTSATAFFGIGGHQEPFRPFAELTSASAPPPDIDPKPGEGFVIIHTAAVDGKPRGALLSQVGLIAASIQQLRYWQLDERDVAVVAVPLFHVTGLGLMLTMWLAGGASVVEVKFEPDAVAQKIEAEKATVFAEFAPMLSGVLDKAAELGASLDSLRAVVGLDTPDTIRRFEAACPNARFWAVYGQSETSGIVTIDRKSVV